ncbi:hypothetical protein MJ563_04680 [Klebsiella pneumoniae]|nr:hypothetical protein MJ563_04680 [Klebsiella pneumoniae]
MNQRGEVPVAEIITPIISGAIIEAILTEIKYAAGEMPYFRGNIEVGPAQTGHPLTKKATDAIILQVTCKTFNSPR